MLFTVNLWIMIFCQESKSSGSSWNLNSRPSEYRSDAATSHSNFWQRPEDNLHKQHYLQVSAKSHSLSANYSEPPPCTPYSEPAMLIILGYVWAVQLYTLHHEKGAGGGSQVVTMTFWKDLKISWNLNPRPFDYYSDALITKPLELDS